LGVWILSLVRDDISPFTGTKTGDYAPVWDPSGQKVYYSSLRSGNYEIFSKDVGSTGDGILFFNIPNKPAFIDDISADGKNMVYSSGATSSGDIYLLSVGEKNNIPLLNAKCYEENGKISPEMDLLAYESNKSGQFEIYLCTFPDVEGPQRKVSVGGGYDPLWSPNGRKLYYRSEDSVMSVSIETESDLDIGIPVPLFKDNYALFGTNYSWDIDLVGKRFLMAKDNLSNSRKGIVAPPKINVILNWFEELKQKVPAP
jgi:Tol biopolymer transport system component